MGTLTGVRALAAPPPAPPTARRRRGPAQARGGRHPDYMSLKEDPLKPAVVRPRPDLEADPRYRRVDFSDELAAQARLQFAACLAAGEAALPLARAALLVAAEDDAIASSSTVAFPVDAFLDRIRRLAHDTAQALAAAAPPPAAAAAASDGPWAVLRALPADEVVAAVERAVFRPPEQQQGRRRTPPPPPPPPPQQQQQQQGPPWYSAVPCAGYTCPHFGRSNLPPNAVVAHPGVWEDARLGYLNEALVTRRGCPAALAILYAEVMQQLLIIGAVDFAVTFDYRGFSWLPHATALPNVHREQLVLPGAQQAAGGGGAPRLLNTCSSDALAELLRHLKRAYWPFQWDTNLDDPRRGGRASSGGFRAAAKAALGPDSVSADLRAVSATAAHRLQRGIWTSPGAGDLNRCVASAERLVMMVGDEQPQERRDLAVLLLHAGRPSAAAAELGAYLDCVGGRGGGGGGAADPFDARLADRLWQLLTQGPAAVEPDREVASVEGVLKRGAAGTRAADGPARHKPLTW